MCHDSASVTGGVPGLIVRSVIPDRHGYPLGSLHEGSSTDAMPIATRWGGWYATGSGADDHMGNTMAPVLTHEVGNVRQYVAGTPLKPVGTLDRLDKAFDTSAYLSSHSDLVALLILTHQARVHNLITSAGFEARIALFEENARIGFDAPGSAHAAAIRRVQSAAEPLVRAMLFADERPLSGAVRGSSSYTADFEARGPRDSKGRSLRKLDLEHRLFAYPLSYLIYSESFNALPGPVKDYAYGRFLDVLQGRDERITHLSDAQRQAIFEILEETKPDFVAASNDSSGP
jgi:hypothetical protein